MGNITKLELVAEIGAWQLDLVQTYLKGLLSSVELGHLIGESKAMLVERIFNEYPGE